MVDFRGIPAIREAVCPVIFDATHSVQLPGGAGRASSGQRDFAAPLARAAVAAGADGIFLEIHPDPGRALSDGPNSLPLEAVEPLVTVLLRIVITSYSIHYTKLYDTAAVDRCQWRWSQCFGVLLVEARENLFRTDIDR